jgi:hypothetical protein
MHNQIRLFKELPQIYDDRKGRFPYLGSFGHKWPKKAVLGDFGLFWM